MAKFRKRPVEVEATQWFKNGDHPKDGDERFESGEHKGERLEGKVVRYYRHPGIPGQNRCGHCGKVFDVHGWIDTLEGGHIVCPGDWVITGTSGETYPCKPNIFADIYEPADQVTAEQCEAMHPQLNDALTQIRSHTREVLSQSPVEKRNALQEIARLAHKATTVIP